MRLTHVEQAAIRRSAVDAFGEGAVVRVFGSRLDDDRRGGDIDLHVEAPGTGDGFASAARFRLLLNQRVGERDYDIVVSTAGAPPSSIDRKARREGIVV